LLRTLQSQQSTQPSASNGVSEEAERARRIDSEARLKLRTQLQLIKEHMIQCNIEILVLLEGVDATTSSTCQARQSYTVDDICWDATFVPAARRQPDGGVRVDFDKMHEVHPLGHILPAAQLMRMPTLGLGPYLVPRSLPDSSSPSPVPSPQSSRPQPPPTCSWSVDTNTLPSSLHVPLAPQAAE